MIKAKKSLGQNFLNNDVVLNRIANSIDNIDENDLIIEIGPGMGALTKYLVKKNSFLLCYEIDERMKPYLEKYKGEKTKIIYQDFLKSDVIDDINKYSLNKLYVVANIPYYITSLILLKLIKEVKASEIILLVQKEFAKRIVANANTKDYNALTLFVDLEYDAKILFDVDRNNFNPVPNVDSAVIKLVRKENKLVNNPLFYLKFIKDAFQNKRKTLRNNLKDYDYEKIKEILNGLGYNENVRAEQISKEDFKYLVNKIEE